MYVDKVLSTSISDATIHHSNTHGHLEEPSSFELEDEEFLSQLETYVLNILRHQICLFAEWQALR